MDIDFRFIVVNDGSSKGIREVDIQKIQSELTNCQFISHHYNIGKGQAIRSGVESCYEGHIIYCDIDFPFGTEPFNRLIGKLNAGNLVVVGKRDNSYHKCLPWLRRSISKLFQFINKLMIPSNLSGCQAGMMGMQNEVKSLFLSTRINRFLFSTEFAIKIHKKKLKYTCVALTLRDIDPHTTVNMKSMFQEFSNLLFIITRIPFFKF